MRTTHAAQTRGTGAVGALVYDHTKWLLERVDSFPKNQRFIFGTRLADTALNILELLVEASYSRHKASLLHRANVQPSPSAVCPP